MECRRGLAMRILSVRQSVTRMNCNKTLKRSVQIFYHTKGQFAQFSEKKNGWWVRPLLPEISGQPAPFGAKLPILQG